jgi:hypothetical protein
LNPEIPPSSILEKELLKRNEQLEEKVARLEKENRILRDLRRLDLIKKYGPGSESLSLEQLELLELEPGVKDAEVAAEAQREPIPAAAKKERQHPGRQELPGIWSESNKSSHAHPSSAFAGSAVKRNRSSVTKPVKYSRSNRPNTLSR